MKRSSIILFHLIFFLLFSSAVHGQFYFIEDSYDQIQLQFLKKKIETRQAETFFNVLNIINPTNREVEIIANFSYPQDWSFFGDKQQRITIPPNDTIYIPFRASASSEAIGDIGYTIVASVSDIKGNVIKNEYSFIDIPKEQKFIYKPIERLVYFDQNNLTADIEFYIANQGNTDEVCYFDVNLDNALVINNNVSNLYRQEVMLHPLTDTTISIPVTLKPNLNYQNKDFHRIAVKTYTQDTAFNTTIWSKELKDSYFNEVPDEYKMLTIDYSIHNLFKEEKPSHSLSIYGNVLFKDPNKRLRYYFQGNGTNLLEDPWKYSKCFVTYSTKHFIFTTGNIYESIGISSIGRGVSIAYKNDRSFIKSFYTLSLDKDIQTAGLSYNRTSKIINFGLGGAYSSNSTKKLDRYVGLIQLGKSIPKIGSIFTSFASSISNYNFDNGYQYLGYFARFQYSLNQNKTKISLSTMYSDKYYAGDNSGRFNIDGRIDRPITNRLRFLGTYYQTNFAPPEFSNGILQPIDYNNLNTSKLSLFYNLKPSILWSNAIISEGQKANQFAGYDDYFAFGTRSYKLNSSIRFFSSSKRNSLNITGEGGLININKYPTELFSIDTLNNNWINYELSANLRSRIWSIYVSYTHGPKTVYQQFNYFSSNYFTKYVRVIPSLDIPVLKDIIRFQSTLNYSYDISAQTSRVNLSNNLIGRPGETWEITFSGSFIYQSNYDEVLDDKYSYSSTYFELRVVKDFLFDQPRYQYHDLDVYFFKDFNGNRIKDDGEPGISGVLFSIQHNDEQSIDNNIKANGNFMPIELLSDINGHVSYKNIPTGFYDLEYFPISEIKGAYTSESSTQVLGIQKDEVLYIPFTENNKIFGKVILNRSKLSNLGVIDIGNIKVTAEDSYGKLYSTLTDKNGNFAVYVPSVDKYKVKINNIFFENFELEQNNYEVQLNGYRQFEINFIFNEKKRKVNFASSYEYGSTTDGPGVEIVRRTNVMGTIKDATSLKPIAAKVRIIDKEGKEIATTESNSTNGNYMASFIAGNDYILEITADDYWFYDENLYNNQIVTFKNLNKDVLLKSITVGAIIPMKTLNFASGSYEIPATAFPELERLLKVLRKNPSVLISVHGHADDLEVLDSQTDIALERAKMVAKYLIANGYNRVKYQGHANTKPIAENDTEDGRKQNRRVEIVVTAK